jgi:polar amino acid transport system substrate-binding protein
LLAGHASAKAGKTVTLCGDIWCPYNCAPGAHDPGFAVEIAQAAFGPAGYSVDYQTVNWARCIEDARRGRYSGIIGAIQTDAPDFIFPTSWIGQSSNGYATRKGDIFHYTGEKSLDGRVLGLVRDYNFTGKIGAYITAHAQDTSRIVYASGNGALRKNLDKLLAGRVDVVVDDWNVLRMLVQTEGLQDRLTLEYGADPAPVYIAFSPRAPQPQILAKILDNGIARLRASGRLAAILAKYHVTEWK